MLSKGTFASATPSQPTHTGQLLYNANSSSQHIISRKLVDQALLVESGALGWFANPRYSASLRGESISESMLTNELWRSGSLCRHLRMYGKRVSIESYVMDLFRKLVTFRSRLPCIPSTTVSSTGQNLNWPRKEGNAFNSSHARHTLKYSSASWRAGSSLNSYISGWAL